MDKNRILLQRSGMFGEDPNLGTYFDDCDELKYDFRRYRVKKVTVYVDCQAQDKRIIAGIEFTYVDRFNKNKEFSIGTHKGEYNEEYSFTLAPGEYLTRFGIWDSPKQGHSFSKIEFCTSKGSKFQYGSDGDEILTGVKNHLMIIAPYGRLKGRITAMGVYFVDRYEYMDTYFSEYFFLRASLFKHPELREQCEKAAQDKDESWKALVKTSLLPKGLFLNIMLYFVY